MLSQHGFLWFWICSLIRSQLVCVVSISISCISDLILTCSRIQKKGISATFQIFSKKKKVPKNQHFFTHHPYFLDINTTHSTWHDCSILMSAYRPVTPYYRKTAPFVIGNWSTAFSVHENLSTTHFDCSREQVENCSLTYDMRFHISAHRLDLQLQLSGQ